MSLPHILLSERCHLKRQSQVRGRFSSPSDFPRLGGGRAGVSGFRGRKRQRVTRPGPTGEDDMAGSVPQPGRPCFQPTICVFSGTQGTLRGELLGGLRGMRGQGLLGSLLILFFHSDCGLCFALRLQEPEKPQVIPLPSRLWLQRPSQRPLLSLPACSLC